MNTQASAKTSPSVKINVCNCTQLNIQSITDARYASPSNNSFLVIFLSQFKLVAANNDESFIINDTFTWFSTFIIVFASGNLDFVFSDDLNTFISFFTVNVFLNFKINKVLNKKSGHILNTNHIITAFCSYYFSFFLSKWFRIECENQFSSHFLGISKIVLASK